MLRNRFFIDYLDNGWELEREMWSSECSTKPPPITVVVNGIMNRYYEMWSELCWGDIAKWVLVPVILGNKRILFILPVLFIIKVIAIDRSQSLEVWKYSVCDNVKKKWKFRADNIFVFKASCSMKLILIWNLSLHRNIWMKNRGDLRPYLVSFKITSFFKVRKY